jgi:hypothetical protein
MRLEKLSTIVNKLRTDFELDAIDIELLNTVKDCGGDAYVMKVIEKFDVVSPATTHKRIKHLLAKDYLDHEGTAGNLRTKLLIPSGRWAELDAYLRSLK